MLIIFLLIHVFLVFSYFLGSILNELLIPEKWEMHYVLPLGVLSSIGGLQLLYYLLDILSVPHKAYILATLCFFLSVLILSVFYRKFIVQALKTSLENKKSCCLQL